MQRNTPHVFGREGKCKFVCFHTVRVLGGGGVEWSRLGRFIPGKELTRPPVCPRADLHYLEEMTSLLPLPALKAGLSVFERALQQTGTADIRTISSYTVIITTCSYIVIITTCSCTVIITTIPALSSLRLVRTLSSLRLFMHCHHCNLFIHSSLRVTVGRDSTVGIATL